MTTPNYIHCFVALYMNLDLTEAEEEYFMTKWGLQ